VDPADAYRGAVDVMRAWIDNTDDIDDIDDIDEVLNLLENRGDKPAHEPHVLCGLVKLCGSMLLDLEELTRTPMAEILQDHARRRP
jgi:hypothetical protein